MATLGVTGAIVDGHFVDSQTLAAVDADGLDGSVLDVKIVDLRFAGQLVGSEELRLGFTAIATLAVPPARTIGVQFGAAGTGDSDVLAANIEKRTLPFLVTPGGCALKDDLDNVTVN